MKRTATLMLLLGTLSAMPAFAQDDADDIADSITNDIKQTEQSMSDDVRAADDTAADAVRQADRDAIQSMSGGSRTHTESRSSSSSFSIGIGPENDDTGDDRPAWANRPAPMPSPEQMDGTYQLSQKNGSTMCTVNLSKSAYFGGYYAYKSAACPTGLFGMSRWVFDGGSLALTSTQGEVVATLWPRGRNVWAGRIASTGERISLSR